MDPSFSGTRSVLYDAAGRRLTPVGCSNIFLDTLNVFSIDSHCWRVKGPHFVEIEVVVGLV